MKNKTTDIDDIFASAKPKKALATPGASKSTTSTAAPIQSKTSVSASKSGADVKSKATVSKSGLPKADATYQEPAQTLSDSLYTDLRGTKNRTNLSFSQIRSTLTQ